MGDRTDRSQRALREGRHRGEPSVEPPRTTLTPKPSWLGMPNFGDAVATTFAAGISRDGLGRLLAMARLKVRELRFQASHQRPSPDVMLIHSSLGHAPAPGPTRIAW